MPVWKESWIGPSSHPEGDVGVFAFRNRFELSAKPAKLPIKISADNRFKLYVNGEMVAFGPQRGVAQHWFYDELNLGPYLKAGENEIVALVWNFGWMAPMAQHTVRTGFLVSGKGLETPGNWEVARMDGWGFEMMHTEIGGFYIDVGPGEIIAPHLLPNPNSKFQNLKWNPPQAIGRAEDRPPQDGGVPWAMIPRTLPAMRYDVRRSRPKICRGSIGDDPSLNLEDGTILDGPVTLEPGAKLLLDYGELLCAYPRLVLSGPEGATVTLTYSEGMWNEDGTKGNRNDYASKKMRGYQDKLILGSAPSLYEPLWWRTYRYLMVELSPIPQSGSSLREGVGGGRSSATIHSVDAIETGYPYDVQSSFEADEPSVEKIWEVAVRTAERCAGETYFDCPYYEQLQYAGDTRIQALIGYYLGRDRRLQRNAVETLGWSMMENGLTQSRYPSRQTQVIPPFSLWWVMMLYDQMLYDTERSFGFQAPMMCSDIIEGYHRSLIDKTFWHFCDWVPDWKAGVPPGCGQTMNWCLVETARIAKMKKLSRAIFSVADEIAIQMGELDSEEDDDHLDHFREGLDEDFEFEDGLVRHIVDEEWTPSEHTEALYRQYQMILGMEPSPWPYAALERANAAKCTYYFSYYKHLAMQPDDYMAQLGPWKEMIENGLSTFAENPEPVRSDCHAWSAHPALGFFQFIAGVTSVAPAWKKARIAPKPGSLKRFDARIAHPDGELRVAYDDGKLTLDTPVPAQFVWKGKTELLKPGKHTF